jgi:hypothetical protein
VKVLLLPVTSGANGLNLVSASHVLLIEPILNPAQELQVIIVIYIYNTFQIQPFHKGLSIQADVAFLFYARGISLILIFSAGSVDHCLTIMP